MRAKVVLPVFQALSISWSMARFPAHSDTILPAAVEAARNVANSNSAYSHPAIDSAADAARSVSYDAIDAAASAARATYYAERATAVTGIAKNFEWPRPEFEQTIFGAVSADMTALEQQIDPANLAGSPLWPMGVPEWARVNWLKLSKALSRAKEDWEVWTNWYEARISGEVAFSPLELARALMSNEILDQGPKVANGEIKRLVVEHMSPGRGEGTEPQSAKSSVIPPIQPAALEPIWRHGILTIPTTPAATDLGEASFASALVSLQSAVLHLANDLDGEANIDHRFIAFLRRTADRIPNAPPAQELLFELGHIEATLSDYSATVNAEWPPILAARYHSLSLQFERTIRQSPAWRTFKANASKQKITKDQISQIEPLAADATMALSRDEATEFIDDLVPHRLGALVTLLAQKLAEQPNAYPPENIQDDLDTLAFDVLESLNNILKRIAQAAVISAEVAGRVAGEAGRKFGRRYAETLPVAAGDYGEKAAKLTVQWLLRFAVVGAASAIGAALGAGVPAATISALIVTFPATFGWLKGSHRIFEAS